MHFANTTATIAALALITAGPALAQKPDPLCADLDKMLGAASEATPFSSLNESTTPGAIQGRYTPSPAWQMREGKKCAIGKPYARAGSESIWHGASMVCELYDSSLAEVSQRAPAAEAKQRLILALKTCPALSNWNLNPDLQERMYGVPRGSHVWTDPKTGISVSAIYESYTRGRRKSKTFYTARMRISLPKPKKASPES